MNFQLNTYIILICLTISMISCKNKNSKSEKENEKGVNSEFKSSVDEEKITEQLQGNWKETEYPFRKVEFKKSMVKFTEEGMVEEPSFEKFQISTECPFDVRNIKNTEADDIFIVLEKNNRCEKLKISNDSLIISGYNVATKNNYRIFYKKEK
ncbi:hypothetical protein [Mesonia maritima]|uniref:Lipocalin-like domain-containing protein n=1 Tax=Mesonia maritima TaxID=1793873 RepID=A0ABU1K340_9FLAO|nr:hypothetical protein [Mesonia maritima]MDR6300031.1 hypothetical protein [Mesonia maritima]